jgi:hypothetical protein
MAHFNLNEYQTVQERIDLFWKRYSSGRFNLELVSMTPEQVVFKAEVYLHKDDLYPATVDFAEERLGSSPVNKTSFVENCATSALGRAISALGGEFSPKGKRASASEMSKVARLSTTENYPEVSRNWQAALATSTTLKVYDHCITKRNRVKPLMLFWKQSRVRPMESLELLQAISVLSANVRELGELVVCLTDDPVLRGKTLVRLNEQTIRLNTLISYMD